MCYYLRNIQSNYVKNFVEHIFADAYRDLSLINKINKVFLGFYN